MGDCIVNCRKCRLGGGTGAGGGSGKSAPLPPTVWLVVLNGFQIWHCTWVEFVITDSPPAVWLVVLNGSQIWHCKWYEFVVTDSPSCSKVFLQMLRQVP